MTLKLDDKVIQQIATSLDVLEDMQRDTLQQADTQQLKGLSFKFGIQMQFFRVEEPGVLRAYAEIDGKQELESQGLRFVR